MKAKASVDPFGLTNSCFQLIFGVFTLSWRSCHAFLMSSVVTAGAVGGLDLEDDFAGLLAGDLALLGHEELVTDLFHT